jgi:116 kDa U5 small nuclear ribonucleoprotein component
MVLSFMKTKIIIKQVKKFIQYLLIIQGVETLVMEEDAQPLTEPIVPVSHKKEYDHLESKIPETTFDFDFMAALMIKPELIRNVKIG